MGPLALLGAFISLAELGIVQLPCDGQKSQIVGFGDFKASTSRLRGSLHPRTASGVLSPSKAKLLALLIPVFAVLLPKYSTARITVNKKAPVFRLGLFYLLGAWRCTTLAWQLPHYHRRSCVSLLSSEWIQVVPQRYCHQAKTCREQVSTRFSAARLRVKSMDGFDKNKFLFH